jgi:hypothetical protein
MQWQRVGRGGLASATSRAGQLDVWVFKLASAEWAQHISDIFDGDGQIEGAVFSRLSLSANGTDLMLYAFRRTALPLAENGAARRRYQVRLFRTFYRWRWIQVLSATRRPLLCS